MKYKFYENLIEEKYQDKDLNLSRTYIFFDKKRLKEILKINGISICKWAGNAGYKESTLLSYLSSGRVSFLTAIKIFRGLCENWEELLCSIELSQYKVCFDLERPDFSERFYDKDKPFTRRYLNYIANEE